MNDPMLSLAMAVHANPGVYALLLGSGVSRAAGIPTGWEVVEDLVRKIAALNREDCGTDPAAWYRGKFGTDPDYSLLLDSVAKSPSERQQLLRSYFEPVEEEREEGLKQPTPAHRAIARLVANGYIRVILTTNFDKLMERAIEAEGVTPTVISTPDAIDGALPLVHQRCCVVKLHGDYLDTRIKNTPAELAGYDDRVKRLLAQVFDEFGLIVSGWSGQSDTALRAALERCPTRRFTMFWTARREPGDIAKELIRLRSGQTIVASDADTVFTKLDELVTALAESRRPHPASTEAALALTKRYLTSPESSIRLYDLVVEEAEDAYGRLSEYNRDFIKEQRQAGDCEPLLRAHRETVETCLRMAVELAIFAKPEHHHIVAELVQRLARPPMIKGRPVGISEEVAKHPAVLIYTAIGMTALAREQYELFTFICQKPVARGGYRSLPLLIDVIRHTWAQLGQFVANGIQQYSSSDSALADYLCVVLRGPLRRLLPGDDEYEILYDRYEYVRALACLDLEYRDLSTPGHIWTPLGRLGGKARWGMPEAFGAVECEVTSAGADWPLLKHGLFRGAVERVQACQQALRKFVGGESRF